MIESSGIIVSIVAGLILFFSFIGGYTQGAVKSFFSLISLIIAIPVAGIFYPFFAGLLSFLPGRDWENFIGFFITLAIASIILAFVFFLPRKLTENTWPNGLILRLIGGFLNLLGAGIGLVMFKYLFSAFPVWDWLREAIVNSSVINWLVSTLGFVLELLPEVIRNSIGPGV